VRYKRFEVYNLNDWGTDAPLNKFETKVDENAGQPSLLKAQMSSMSQYTVISWETYGKVKPVAPKVSEMTFGTVARG
jgi:hypothetical protein